jgi:hypothetical protein
MGIVVEKLEALELETIFGEELRRRAIAGLRDGENPDSINWAKTLIMGFQEETYLFSGRYADVNLLLGALIETAQDRAHARFEERVAGLKSRLLCPESVKFLESVLGVLRGDCKLWADVRVEHARPVIDTALAALWVGPQVTGDEQLDSDHAELIRFFDYARDSDDE